MDAEASPTPALPFRRCCTFVLKKVGGVLCHCFSTQTFIDLVWLQFILIPFGIARDAFFFASPFHTTEPNL